MSEIDQSVITIGPPKCGKTTIVRQLVRAHLLKYPEGIALVHDVNHQFKDLCAMYETVAEWHDKRELALAAGETFPRGAAFFGFRQSKDIAELALRLGREMNTAGDVRMPIFLAYDESAMMTGSGSTYIGELDLQINTSRRHLGIALAYNTQRESALMQAFFETATDVFVFRQSSEESVRSIEKKIGLQRGALMKLLVAENFTYAHWASGGRKLI